MVTGNTCHCIAMGMSSGCQSHALQLCEICLSMYSGDC